MVHLMASRDQIPPADRSAAVGIKPRPWRRNLSPEEVLFVLNEGHWTIRGSHRVFRHLPSPPRCKTCYVPFDGIGGRVARLAGFKRSRKNPSLCSHCCESITGRGGAEVDIAVLFADVRGSTALGERATPTEFAALLNRFYSVATDTLVRHDAVIDKLIGDEVMAFFVRGISGPGYRRRAVEAGTELLSAVGYGTPEGPWLSMGVAVNAGLAYVGNVGDAVTDFTALGDTVNVAARMQGEAASGELLIREGLGPEPESRLQRRTLNLRGHQEPIEVLVVSA
ncbi:MAG: adenylate cyclase [Thermoleophilaceae bacterium]|nr:adenylate cyclase [Thermoleophilaceae bacterium]